MLLYVTKGSVPSASASNDEKRKSQQERSRRFGVEALDGKGERLIFGAGMPTKLEDYGDPVNLKFPLVPDGRARNARARFKQFAATYSKETSRRVVHTRIVERLLQIGAKPGFDPDDALDKLLPASLQRRMLRGKQEKTMQDTELMVEIAKLDLPDGMEVLDFGNLVMDMLVKTRAKLKKSLSLIGIYQDYIVTKDRESGRLFKMALGVKDGEISLGSPVEVRQQFSEVKAKTEKGKVKKVTVETGETNGHKHQATVDETGAGETDEVEGHKHAVTGGKVATVQGHTHSLDLSSADEAGDGEEEMSDKDKKGAAKKSDDSPRYVKLSVAKSANIWAGIIR